MKKIFSRSWLGVVVMSMAMLSVSCATPAIKKPNKPSTTSSSPSTSTNKPKVVEKQSKTVIAVEAQKDTVN